MITWESSVWYFIDFVMDHEARIVYAVYKYWGNPYGVDFDEIEKIMKSLPLEWQIINYKKGVYQVMYDNIKIPVRYGNIYKKENVKIYV